MLEPIQEKGLSTKEFKSKVVDLENQLLASNNPLVVKGNSEAFPLTHSFSEGIYVREMSMRKGGMVVGKLHNRSHTWFLMKGHLTVVTEGGSNDYIAPTYVNSFAGAKRVIWALEDSVFINVHPNPDNITDTDKLEDILTCKDYKEYEEFKNKTI